MNADPSTRRWPLARLVSHPSAWRPSDFDGEHDWLRRLTPEQVNQLAAQAEEWSKALPELGSLRAVAQDLPALEPLVQDMKRDLSTRGFVLVRGLPVEELGDHLAGLAFWALGTLMGTPVTQNARGDLICPVTDMGVRFGYSGAEEEKNVRGYQSRADLNYHCDSADLVSLLCLRQAKSGGASTIVSTPTVYNEFVLRHPEHLGVLERGFPYDRKGEEGPGEAQVSRAIPVFYRHADSVSSRYARSFILGGAIKQGVPLTPDEIAALDCFDRIAREPDVALSMSFQPGDMQWVNNLTVVHGRTAYEDHPEPGRRRFLHRLWVDMGGESPWSREGEVMRWEFGRYGNLGIPATEAGRLVAPAADRQEEIS